MNSMLKIRRKMSKRKITVKKSILMEMQRVVKRPVERKEEGKEEEKETHQKDHRSEAEKPKRRGNFIRATLVIIKNVMKIYVSN